MPPKWRWEMVTWLIADLSRETLILSKLVKVVGSTEDKEGHSFMETLLVVHPLFGGGSCNQESDESSQQSTMMTVSGEGNQPVQAGRGLRVKVILPIFKDEKTKDAVTYCSWQYFLLLSLGWPAFAAICLQVIARTVPWMMSSRHWTCHYDMVMMFDALSKELYSLKQGSGNNVAKFGVCLSQQVQILLLEYPGRIQQEHIEKMKRNHFYKGLNPKYLWMLAHKVDGEHLAGYSDLLLAVQKLERQAEARDPLLPKTTTTGGLNLTCSQTPGNLFPSQKLKGSCTFTWSSTVESNEVKEDLGMKQKGEEEAKSSAEEDTETSSRVGGVDQELYLRKNQNCFRCGSPDHLLKDCLKDLSKTTWKASLNMKEGMMNKGCRAP